MTHRIPPQLILRLGLAVLASRVPDGRAPAHDLIIALSHRLEIVIPTALRQAVGKVVDQHARLVDLKLLGNGGVRTRNERSPVRIGLG
jgi:hypothetical protein